MYLLIQRVVENKHSRFDAALSSPCLGKNDDGSSETRPIQAACSRARTMARPSCNRGRLGAPAVSITSARADIRERLLAHGFTEEFLGVDDPPATHYHLRDEASGFYAEFLTPLTGSSTDRKGQRKATLEIA